MTQSHMTLNQEGHLSEMSIKSVKTVSVFIYLFLSVLQYSYALECHALISHSDSLQNHGLISERRVARSFRAMTFNVNKLYVEENRYIYSSEREYIQDSKAKDLEQTKEIARIISVTNPDFLVLQEVENERSLHRFANNFLGAEYLAFYLSGSDEQIPGTAFLIKKDLGFQVRRGSTSQISWRAPSGHIEPVFTRELGVFEVVEPNSNKVVFGVFGLHFKSYRDRKNDPRSLLKRTKEAEVTTQFVGQFEDRYPNVPYIVAGDFNAESGDPELVSLFEDLNLIDPISIEGIFNNRAGLGGTTHSSHPDGTNETILSQIDMILTPAFMQESLLSSDIHRYKDRSTNDFFPLPSSSEERNRNPSDHHAVVIDFTSSIIYKAEEREE